MLKHTKWVALGWVFAAAVGCSSSSNNGNGGGGGESSKGTDGPSGTGSVDSYCESSCEKTHGCNKKIDTQTCTDECENNLAASSSKLRGDFLSSLTACFDDEDCVNALNGDALTDCHDVAVAELAPSKEGSSFCSDYQDAIEKCDGEFSKAACLVQAKTFNDKTIKKAEACLDKTCSDIDACVAAAFGSVEHIGGEDVEIIDDGTGGTGNGTGGTGNGTSGSGSSGKGNTAGSGGGLATGDCDDTSPQECASGTTINTCVNGSYKVVTCKAYWEAYGLSGDKCTSNACPAGGVLDQECATGVANACECKTDGCTDTEKGNYYINCYNNVESAHSIFGCIAAATTCDAVNACVDAGE